MISAIVIVAGYVALIWAAGWPGAAMVAIHLIIMAAACGWKARP